VENSTKGPTPPIMENLLTFNDLHAMKQILYDTGPQIVARWLLQRVFTLRNSDRVKRPSTPLKDEGEKVVVNCFLDQSMSIHNIIP